MLGDHRHQSEFSQFYTYAEIDFETARGIWLLDEGKGDKNRGYLWKRETHGETSGRKMGQRVQMVPALSLNGQDDRVIIADSKKYVSGRGVVNHFMGVCQQIRERLLDIFSAKRPAAGTVAKLRLQDQLQRQLAGKLTFANGGWKGAWNQSQVKKR